MISLTQINWINTLTKLFSAQKAQKIISKVLKKAAYFIAAIVLLEMVFHSSVTAGSEIIIDDFENGVSSRWEKEKFVGETIYKLTEGADGKCLRATSDKSASGLYYKIDFNPREYPIITWSWKIDHVLTHGDARKKSGDDYAARVYVIFPSFFFWQTRAINYIWANKLPKGEAVPSSYTDNSVMVAVESGPEMAGKWLVEKRNLLEDYKRYFGKTPKKAGAIAIMTDTDNTRESAAACYDSIKIMSAD